MRIWDIDSGSELVCIDLGDKAAVESLSWSADGTRLAVVSKDKLLRIVDARSGTVDHSIEAHDGVKAMRVVWLGNDARVVTAGFSKMRERQLMLWGACPCAQARAH